MKLPTIFKTASHQRFAIKPRYYDPIKEEIEERTSRIKMELEQEGEIEQSSDPSSPRRPMMKGSFATFRSNKPRENAVFNSSTLLRTLLFLGMVLAAFGYIYVGPQIFTYMGYTAVGIGGFYYLLRFLKSRKNA
jgi:Flp pilus assembly protein TadB